MPMPILIALLIALAGFNAAADVRFITETENTADYEKFQKLNPKYAPQADNYALCLLYTSPSPRDTR